MIRIIQQQLAELEREKGIKILHACESGSRAWGFASPDSDYDVRLLYVHHQDWYVSLKEGRDCVEKMLEGRDLDLSGWELRKALNLLCKGNSALFEWIYSPMVYCSDEGFMKQLRQLAPMFFSPIRSMYHYLNKGQKYLERLEGHEGFKLKSFFYALRCALACKWILEKREFVPVEFQKLVKGLQLDGDILDGVEKLLHLKRSSLETYIHKDEPALIDFIQQTLLRAEYEGRDLPAAHGDLFQLEELFRRTVKWSQPSVTLLN